MPASFVWNVIWCTGVSYPRPKLFFVMRNTLRGCGTNPSGRRSSCTCSGVMPNTSLPASTVVERPCSTSSCGCRTVMLLVPALTKSRAPLRSNMLATSRRKWRMVSIHSSIVTTCIVVCVCSLILLLRKVWKPRQTETRLANTIFLMIRTRSRVILLIANCARSWITVTRGPLSGNGQW